MSLIKSIPKLRMNLRRQVATAGAVLAVAVVSIAAAADDARNSLYDQHCVTCHGADLGGVDNLGTDLRDSALIQRSSKEELVEFLKVGRMPNDPDSIMNRPMPGFGWMGEDDLADIAGYLKEQAQ